MPCNSTRIWAPLLGSGPFNIDFRYLLPRLPCVHSLQFVPVHSNFVHSSFCVPGFGQCSFGQVHLEREVHKLNGASVIPHQWFMARLSSSHPLLCGPVGMCYAYGWTMMWAMGTTLPSTRMSTCPMHRQTVGLCDTWYHVFSTFLPDARGSEPLYLHLSEWSHSYIYCMLTCTACIFAGKF